MEFWRQQLCHILQCFVNNFLTALLCKILDFNLKIKKGGNVSLGSNQKQNGVQPTSPIKEPGHDALLLIAGV